MLQRERSGEGWVFFQDSTLFLITLDGWNEDPRNVRHIGPGRSEREQDDIGGQELRERLVHNRSGLEEEKKMQRWKESCPR